MYSSQQLITPFQKKMFNLEHERHTKRLEHAQSFKKKATEEKDLTMRSTFFDLHTKHIQFQTAEKISSLDKTNKVLLEKLVKISKNQKPALYKSTHWSGHPGTLNTTYRKKELERIAQENEAMAKRLISQKTSVDHKKLKIDFEKQRELVKNSSKFSFVSPKSPSKLPPIQSPKAEPTAKDSRNKNNKRERKSGEQQATTDSHNNTAEKINQENQPAIRVEEATQEIHQSQETVNKSQTQLSEAHKEDPNQKNNAESTGSKTSVSAENQPVENKEQEVEEETKKSESEKVESVTNASRKGSKKLSVEPVNQLNKSIEVRKESKEVKEDEKIEEKEEVPAVEENDVKENVEKVEEHVEENIES